jgi:DNA-binding LacI/PurR family transcriptional regulator
VEQSGDRARYAGYRSAMRRAKVPALPVFGWKPGDATVRVGKRLTPLANALRGEDSPTAVFVSNDIGAIAILEACEVLEVRVPDDLSIVGFDDIDIASLHRVSLTTVAQPFDLQAETAVGLLLERIDKPGLRPRHVSVPVELRLRESTAGPPAGLNKGRASRSAGARRRVPAPAEVDGRPTA